MKANEVLNYHHLKRTSCREGIIDVVMSSDEALSEAEIRERLQGCYDRTTFYRSFKTLEENKIIHKIIVDNNLVKYAYVCEYIRRLSLYVRTLQRRLYFVFFFSHSMQS